MYNVAETRPTSDIELGLFNQNPPGIGLLGLIREDFETHDRDIFSYGFWAIAVHRFGNWRMSVPSRVLRIPLSVAYKIMFRVVECTCGISLNYTVKVGRRVRIWHRGGMTLGALAIGDDVHIRQNTTFGVRRRGDHRWLKPVIGDRCDIGAGAVVVGPVTVGHDSVIGANVVVSKDIPPYSVVTLLPPQVRSRQPRAMSGDES